MRIKRDISTEFVLTDEELEAAYREREHQYRLMDAEIQLSDYFGINTEANSPVDEDDSHNNSLAFLAEHGYPFEELLNKMHSNYALDSLVLAFEDEKDCNVPENSTWSSVIEDYFRREIEEDV